jgi:hypothetical protein
VSSVARGRRSQVGLVRPGAQSEARLANAFFQRFSRPTALSENGLVQLAEGGIPMRASDDNTTPHAP